MLKKKYGGGRDWYNVNRTGSGNDGHDFRSLIKTKENHLTQI